jgi:hypothetical protein
MEKEVRVWNMPLDPERSVLEQMEEFCVNEGNDQDFESLRKEILLNPRRLSALTHIRVASERTSDLTQT